MPFVVTETSDTFAGSSGSVSETTGIASAVGMSAVASTVSPFTATVTVAVPTSR